MSTTGTLAGARAHTNIHKLSLNPHTWSGNPWLPSVVDSYGNIFMACIIVAYIVIGHAVIYGPQASLVGQKDETKAE